ncbi:MAG TPA: ribonuclease H-like domain-containing protein [Pyrinomonadaceae bacterium]|nr:ribonuclease H-like domain-containing protein [Pyrinomonadaceae bacterium]
MKGNIPIPELPFSEEVWLMVAVTAVRERRTQQGKPFRDASARNATGSLALKVWAEVLEGREDLKPGLWGVTGKLEAFQDRSQFVVSEYKPITIDQYREYVGCDPLLPRAFTLDIETLALPGFRDRVGPKLEKDLKLGIMRLEQQQRYLEDIAAEEERVYQLGSLNATSGRVLSIAVHVGAIPGFEIEGLTSNQGEHAFGIDEEGNEQEEAEALRGFLALISDFDLECDEIVGHNIIGFDLPFIFQRCLVNNIAARPPVNLGEYNVRGVFDTMKGWWLGSRNRVGLDDVAWALGIESSKTDEVEGSKVFDLYQAGRLAEIREYNLNDVRVTRKVYKRLITCFGR